MKTLILFLLSFELLSQLKGTKDNMGVSLNWSVDSSLTHTEVYRSNNAVDWNLLGTSYHSQIFDTSNFYDSETTWLYYKVKFINGNNYSYSNIIYFGYNSNYSEKYIKQLDYNFKLTIIKQQLTK